jgi:hypothetical protein
MVFELPVTDFPDHDQRERMASHDLVKEGYLHSSTLRWSAGGIRGRSTEWQFPIQRLPAHTLVPGLAAIGFGALLLDTYGYADGGTRETHDITRVLGPPLATEGTRILVWDIGRARPRLLAGLDRAARDRLARRMLGLPRLYSRTDVNPLWGRGDGDPACAAAGLLLVNPQRRPQAAVLTITVDRTKTDQPTASARIRGVDHHLRIGRPTHIRLRLSPGTTQVHIRLRVPDVRCDDVEDSALPTVAATLSP